MSVQQGSFLCNRGNRSIIGMYLSLLIVSLSLLVAAIVQAAPVVKPQALDIEILERQPVPANSITLSHENDRIVKPGTAWLADVDPMSNLTFAGYRETAHRLRFTLVLVCDPASDRLVLMKLSEGETPLDVLHDKTRRRVLENLVFSYHQGGKVDFSGSLPVELSLRETIAKRKLGPPLPLPEHIYAVAANFPSHLRHDLAIRDTRITQMLSNSRPRIFLKYPPVLPPGEEPSAKQLFSGIIGPFDDIQYPGTILLPSQADGESLNTAGTRVDYEVEIGIVMGRSLSWESIQGMDDITIRRAVAGYVLMGDTKARNPQVFGKIASFDKAPSAAAAPYLIGDKDLDEALGFWDSTTAQWWSYAASWGEYASMGPFFVAARPDASFPVRALITARTYAPQAERGLSVPEGRLPATFYVRQASVVTEELEADDRMIWNVPQIVKSILAPQNALSFLNGQPRLEAGDIVVLGTPGGTVITSRSHALVDVLEDLVFWWDARDWHDAFFSNDIPLYLRHGDEVFYWAEGLGYQHLRLRRVDH